MVRSALLLRDRHARYHLLLIMVGVGTVVKAAHRGRLLGRVAGSISKVVANESSGITDADPVRRIQLRVPAVRRQADVVAEGLELGRVELDGGVEGGIAGG